MRIDTEEVTHLTGTGIGIDTEKRIVTMRDLVKGMVEEAVKGEEGQIERTAVLVMEEKAVGIDHDLPSGTVAEGHRGVQVVRIRGL